jgi:hypothetical protein
VPPPPPHAARTCPGLRHHLPPLSRSATATTSADVAAVAAAAGLAHGWGRPGQRARVAPPRDVSWWILIVTSDHSALPEKEGGLSLRQSKGIVGQLSAQEITRPQAEASKISARDVSFFAGNPRTVVEISAPASPLTHAHGLSPSPLPVSSPPRSLSLSFPSPSRFPPPAQPAQTLAR